MGGWFSREEADALVHTAPPVDAEVTAEVDSGQDDFQAPLDGTSRASAPPTWLHWLR